MTAKILVGRCCNSGSGAKQRALTSVFVFLDFGQNASYAGAGPHVYSDVGKDIVSLLSSRPYSFSLCKLYNCY